MNETGTKFFLILLGVIGVILLLVVGNHIVIIYRGSIRDVDPDTEARKNIDCFQIVFEVTFISENILEIVNSPLSSFNLDEINLIDSSSGDVFTLSRPLFTPGRDREFDISEFTSDSFYVVPFDCDNLAKLCNRDERICN